MSLILSPIEGVVGQEESILRSSGLKPEQRWITHVLKLVAHY